MRCSICYLVASSLILISYAGFGNISNSSARLVPRDGSADYAAPQVDTSHNPADQLTIIGIVSLLVAGFLAGFVTKGLVNSRKMHSENDNKEDAAFSEKAQSNRIDIQQSDDHADDNLEKVRRFKERIKENAEQPETRLTNSTDTKN
jgi:cytochrome b